MSEELRRAPSEYLRIASPDAAEAFRSLRNSVIAAGPLDPTTCELINIAGLGIAGFEDSFKNHARQLLRTGAVPIASLRHAVVVPLGSTASIFQVARALEWLDQIETT
jgi:alkylhydroperoxidase/carboxymuconolactone decarboxylase family protein YurZ